jgi:hypothetical protein
VSKEKHVTRTVGLWIDHRKAVIVGVTEKGEELGLVISKTEKHPGRVDGKQSTAHFEPHLVPADDSRQRKFTGHLNAYYDAVIAAIREAQSILIFGPGEAKGELQRRIEKSGIRGRVVAVETVDRMTDRQIAARVRRHFAAA